MGVSRTRRGSRSRKGRKLTMAAGGSLPQFPLRRGPPVDRVRHSVSPISRSSIRYCTACDRCSMRISSSPARSAMVRATLRMRSWARALRAESLPPARSPQGTSAPSRPVQWSPARPPAAASAPPGRCGEIPAVRQQKHTIVRQAHPAPESCRRRALNSPHPLLSPAAPAQPGRSAPSWPEPVPSRRFSDCAPVGPFGSAQQNSRNPSVPLCPRSTGPRQCTP